MNIAIINNGIVENVFVCESIEIATKMFGEVCVVLKEGDTPHIGLTYNAETGFEQPVVFLTEETE
jgi:hypothetical protein